MGTLGWFWSSLRHFLGNALYVYCFQPRNFIFLKLQTEINQLFTAVYFNTIRTILSKCEWQVATSLNMYRYDVQRKFYLFCTYVPSNLLTICNSSFITRTQLRGLFRFLTLQDGLLRVPDRKSPRICILGRWCTRLPKTKWDDTGAPLLEWAVPPNGQTLPGLNGWYQFLN